MSGNKKSIETQEDPISENIESWRNEGEEDPGACSDYFRTFQEICEINGFSHETHNITTKDGYILQAFRIQPKETCQFVDHNPMMKTMEFFENFKRSLIGPKKPVIFLQHGLLASADSWIINEETVAPAFALANKGYDVWLGN